MAKNKGTTAAPPAPPAPPSPEVTREPGDEPETPETQNTQDTVAADARVVPHKASAVASLQDVGAMMETDAAESQGHGFERGDVAIPFLRMLQSNSPQVKRKDDAYVEGAEEGSFFNTVTQQVFDGDEGVHFVPVVFQRQATLWWPRETGGPKGEKGFVREIPIPDAERMLRDNTEKNEKGKDVVKEGPHKGQELVFAAMYYGFLVPPGSNSWEPVAYPLTSTQLKKARMWNALIQGARLPNSTGVGSYNPKMYGFAYKLTAVAESNAKGAWSGVKIAKDLPLLEYAKDEKTGQWKPVERFPNGAQLYLAAREFETLMGTGRVKVKHEDMAGGGDGDAVSGEEDTEDKKLPF